MSSGLIVDLDLDLFDVLGKSSNVPGQLIAKLHCGFDVEDPDGLLVHNFSAGFSTKGKFLDLAHVLGVNLLLSGKHLMGCNKCILPVSIVDRNQR